MTRLSEMLAFLFIFIGTQLLGSCELLQLSPTSQQHLSLGNPSQATPTENNPDNFLLEKAQFALSYNRSKGRLNWASWQLNQSNFGDVERQNDFRPDPELPTEWPNITPRLYRKSGYDRGHIVPSGDRTRTIEDNSATFVMSNVVPQAPDNNQGPWVDLEKYARGLVREGKTLQIISGGYGDRKAIGKKSIRPPKRLWKIILVLEKDKVSPNDIPDTSRVIAVDLPNKQGIRKKEWTDYLVTIDDIEAATDYDFLSKLPEKVQKRLESRVDSGS